MALRRARQALPLLNKLLGSKPRDHTAGFGVLVTETQSSKLKRFTVGQHQFREICGMEHHVEPSSNVLLWWVFPKKALRPKSQPTIFCGNSMILNYNHFVDSHICFKVCCAIPRKTRLCRKPETTESSQVNRKKANVVCPLQL